MQVTNTFDEEEESLLITKPYNNLITDSPLSWIPFSIFKSS